MHDDQHGTAMVVSAALLNASRVVGKKYEDLKVVISGAGSAGLAIAQLLLSLDRVENRLVGVDGIKVKEVILLDSRGVIRSGVDWKGKFAQITNQSGIVGGLAEAIVGADAFIGVSKGGIMTSEMVASMAKNAIVLGMANPDPEILPDVAKAAGAAIVGTGRSDYPNQVNNSLIFPGFFQGLLRSRAKRVTVAMKQAARDALTNFVEPTADKILPSMFDPGQAEVIASAVAEQVRKNG
jgi:malate dehydrogenase (oxaloacetate-decarboxylating)